MTESSETRAQLNAESTIAFRNLQEIRMNVDSHVLLTNRYGGYPIDPENQLQSAEDWYDRVIRNLDMIDKPHVPSHWIPPKAP